MKILQLISSTGFFGAENVVFELSSELQNLGHSVTIGIFKNRHNPNLELYEKAKSSSLKTRIFECGGKIDRKTFFSISTFVRENSFDIVHAHGYKSDIYALMSNIRNRRPLVSTCHSWLNFGSKMSMYTYMDKAFLRRFDAVVAVSSRVRDQLSEAGLDEKRVFLIGNGISLERFRLNGKAEELRKQFVPPKGKLVGTVGRLSAEKGHTYMIKAAKKVLDAEDDCFFIIVGDGALRKDLEAEAAALGIRDRFIFTGARHDIPGLLSIMDVFILPSLTEGQPMALLEAMACGKAIVATRVGDVPKILKNGELGLLVPPGDADAGAEAILHYLNNPEEARKKGGLTCDEAQRSYSSARMAEEYVRVYNHILR